MNAEDKQIVMKIVGSVVGLIIMGCLFGFLGVIIGLVAVYFLFKGNGSSNKEPMDDAKFNFIWFCITLGLALVLAYLFGILGVLVGLGLVAGALYNMLFS